MSGRFECMSDAGKQVALTLSGVDATIMMLVSSLHFIETVLQNCGHKQRCKVQQQKHKQQCNSKSTSSSATAKAQKKDTHTFSDPARSTRYSLPESFLSVSLLTCLTLMRKTLWERDECSFMSVEVVVVEVEVVMEVVEVVVEVVEVVEVVWEVVEVVVVCGWLCRWLFLVLVNGGG